MLQSAVAPTVELEASAGVKFSKEVVMKTGIQIQTTKTTIELAGRLSLKIRIAVAAVAGCLLVVPLTRAHKHSSEERGKMSGIFPFFIFRKRGTVSGTILNSESKKDTLNSWAMKVQYNESHISCRRETQRRFAGSIGVGR